MVRLVSDAPGYNTPLPRSTFNGVSGLVAPKPASSGLFAGIASAIGAAAKPPTPAPTATPAAPVAAPAGPAELTPAQIAQNALPHTTPNPGYTWVDAKIAIDAGTGKPAAIAGHWERPRAGQAIVMGPTSGPAGGPVAPAVVENADHREGGTVDNSRSGGTATVTTTDKKTGEKTTTDAPVIAVTESSYVDPATGKTVTAETAVDKQQATAVAAVDQKARADAAAAAKARSPLPNTAGPSQYPVPGATAVPVSSKTKAILTAGAVAAAYMLLGGAL